MEEDRITLTPYEKERTPQPLITDPNRRIAVSPRALKSMFRCSICLDILKSTMMSKECMHRFCNQCIIKALRSGNKECPNCRIKLASKRSLRPDTIMDGFIAKMYPNLEDPAPQTYVSRTAKRNANQVFGDGAAPKKVKLEGDNDEDTEDEDELPVEPVDDEIELVVKPMPNNVNNDHLLNDIRYISTKKVSAVAHIATYLQMRYDLQKQQENPSDEESAESTPNSSSSNANNNSNSGDNSSAKKSNDMKKSSNNKNDSSNSNNSADSNNGHSNGQMTVCFKLFHFAGPGQYNPLKDHMTLADVQDKYWRRNSPMEIYYVYMPTVASNDDPKAKF